MRQYEQRATVAPMGSRRLNCRWGPHDPEPPDADMTWQLVSVVNCGDGDVVFYWQRAVPGEAMCFADQGDMVASRVLVHMGARIRRPAPGEGE